MSSQATDALIPVQPRDYQRRAVPALTMSRPGIRLILRLLLPTAAAAIALLVHRLVPSRQSDMPTWHYPVVLYALLGLSPLLAMLQALFPRTRTWARNIAPIFAAAIMLMCAWDVITLKLALLPLPYFPGPDPVFASLADDWKLLRDCAFHSLLLLMTGYAMGVVAGLISGVLIGWFPRVRYWGMPVLKVLGPIPATAWIPLSMVLFPSSFTSGAALIALAVWFPMTMLTSSGISNVRVSHLEVAKTLGAGRAFLIFRVAIPSALPNIFVGLFMALGAAFLTLIVAEAMGVKAGLGWYADMARNYMEYGKIYAALIVTAVFFSTIMTLLFKVRDRMLVWQKGVLKW